MDLEIARFLTSEAGERLLEAGLDFEVEMVPSEEDEDVVVAMEPEPPTRIRQGSTITLEVSNGMSPEAPMPDLVGMSRADVIVTLGALRETTLIEFQWSFSEIPVADPLEANVVLSTSPPAGSLLTEDSVVVVTITVFDPGAGSGDGEPPASEGIGQILSKSH